MAAVGATVLPLVFAGVAEIRRRRQRRRRGREASASNCDTVEQKCDDGNRLTTKKGEMPPEAKKSISLRDSVELSPYHPDLSSGGPTDSPTSTGFFEKGDRGESGAWSDEYFISSLLGKAEERETPRGEGAEHSPLHERGMGASESTSKVSHYLSRNSSSMSLSQSPEIRDPDLRDFVRHLEAGANESLKKMHKSEKRRALMNKRLENLTLHNKKLKEALYTAAMEMDAVHAVLLEEQVRRAKLEDQLRRDTEKENNNLTHSQQDDMDVLKSKISVMQEDMEVILAEKRDTVQLLRNDSVALQARIHELEEMLEAERVAAAASSAAASANAEQIEADGTTDEGEMESMRARVLDLEKELESRREDYNVICIALASKTSQYVSLLQDHESVRAQFESLNLSRNEELDGLQRRISVMQLDAESMFQEKQDEANALQADIDLLQARVSELEQELETETENWAAAAAATQRYTNSETEERQKMEARVSAMEEELKSRHDDYNLVCIALANKERECAAFDGRDSERSDEIASLRGRITEMRGEEEKLLEEERDKALSLSAEISTLHQQLKEMEQYYDEERTNLRRVLDLRITAIQEEADSIISAKDEEQEKTLKRCAESESRVLELENLLASRQNIEQTESTPTDDQKVQSPETPPLITESLAEEWSDDADSGNYISKSTKKRIVELEQENQRLLEIIEVKEKTIALIPRSTTKMDAQMSDLEDELNECNGQHTSRMISRKDTRYIAEKYQEELSESLDDLLNDVSHFRKSLYNAEDELLIQSEKHLEYIVAIMDNDLTLIPEDDREEGSFGMSMIDSHDFKKTGPESNTNLKAMLQKASLTIQESIKASSTTLNEVRQSQEMLEQTYNDSKIDDLKARIKESEAILRAVASRANSISSQEGDCLNILEFERKNRVIAAKLDTSQNTSQVLMVALLSIAVMVLSALTLYTA